jgi:phthalate 4,5-cis-dihydrodiol dehydrogenase
MSLRDENITDFQQNQNLLNVGVIGLGEQSCDNLIPAIINSDYANLKAVCDIDRDVLHKISKRFGVKEVYLDYDDLFKSKTLDVVVVASTPKVHFDVVKRATDKGIHVFVEKPPVVNSSELEELIELQEVNNCVCIGVGMNFDYTEMSETIRKIIHKHDFFGDLTRVEITHNASKPRAPFWNHDNVVDSFLLAQVIHPLHQILIYGGEVESMSFYASDSDVPIFVEVMFEFKNKAVGILKTSTYFPYFEHNIEIYGSKGIVLSADNINQLRVIDGSEKRDFFKKSPSLHFAHSPLSSSAKNAGYTHEIDSFFKSVIEKKRFKSDLVSMRKTYEILDLLSSELKSRYYGKKAA